MENRHHFELKESSAGLAAGGRPDVVFSTKFNDDELIQNIDQSNLISMLIQSRFDMLQRWCSSIEFTSTSANKTLDSPWKRKRARVAQFNKICII